MDTVTRAEMAIAVAEEGGIGIIDRGFRSGEIEPQVREVQIVKRTAARRHQRSVHDRADASPGRRGGADARAPASARWSSWTSSRARAGLLTTRDLRFADDGGTVAVADDAARAAGDAHRRCRIRARPKRRCGRTRSRSCRSSTRTARCAASSPRRISSPSASCPFATRDAQGRLRVGAAIGAKGDYLERAAELLRAGVDVIVIDIAHGHSVVMARAIDAFRKRFGDVELVAGNVATAEGVRFLARARRQRHQGRHRARRRVHDAAQHELRRAAGAGARRVPAAAAGRVPLIADGGVKRHGALVQALLFGGDTVMLGSALAGTTETPGDVVQKPVVVPESNKTVRVPFKVFRGMASLAGDRRSPRRRGRRRRRRRGARRRRDGNQRPGARLGAAASCATC